MRCLHCDVESAASTLAELPVLPQLDTLVVKSLDTLTEATVQRLSKQPTLRRLVVLEQEIRGAILQVSQQQLPRSLTEEDRATLMKLTRLRHLESCGWLAEISRDVERPAQTLAARRCTALLDEWHATEWHQAVAGRSAVGLWYLRGRVGHDVLIRRIQVHSTFCAKAHCAAGLVGMLGMTTLGVVVLRLHHVQWMAVIGLVSLAVSVATASVHGIVNKSRICLVFLGIPF